MIKSLVLALVLAVSQIAAGQAAAQCQSGQWQRMPDERHHWHGREWRVEAQMARVQPDACHPCGQLWRWDYYYWCCERRRWIWSETQEQRR